MSEPISERETYETATYEENVETILWLLGVNRKWQERAERAEAAIELVKERLEPEVWDTLYEAKRVLALGASNE